MSDEKSVQRSFRLSRRTMERLDEAAAAGPESRNALAERLLDEGLRTETHPLVRFQTGTAGRRQPLLTGTRLYIYQVISTLRGHDGDVHDAADYFGIHPQQVNAAIAYYADFQDEVDADRAAAERFEDLERQRWERQQRAIA